MPEQQNKQQKFSLQCLLETINILDIVCQIDPGHVPKVFQEIRRLYSRLSQDPDKVRLLLPILQFFVHHSKYPVQQTVTGSR